MKSSYIYETKFSLNETTQSDTKIFGCDFSPYVTVGTFGGKLRYNITSNATVAKSQDLNTHIVKVSDYCIVDGERIVSEVSYDIENNCYIFNSSHNNFNSSEYGAKCKIYYFKIYDKDGNILKNMIPVLDKDNVACLYDTIENEFMYNNGTGFFIAGPEI